VSAARSRAVVDIHLHEPVTAEKTELARRSNYCGK
jgi:hypothetical protein